MLSFLSAFEVETSAPRNDVLLVLDVGGQNFFEVQNSRRAVHEGEHDHGIIDLKLRLLVKIVQNDLRVGVLFDVDNDTHAVTVGFFLDVADAFEAFILHLIGDVFDKASLVHLIRNFRENEAFAAVFFFFDVALGSDDATASAGLICLSDGGSAQNGGARREVGARNEFHKVLNLEVRIVDKSNRGVDNFAEVVRRDAGRHTDSYAVGAVYEQVRVSCGKNGRLFAGVVEVRAEIDGFFVDVPYHFVGDFGESCFGVTISRRRIAVDAAEVAVAVDERTTNGEVLRQSYECVVNRAVAMRVIFAQNVAYDERALSVRLVGGEVELVHAVKDTAMNRF